uniref:Elongation of very long chain fatty acids protein n=1 Tax=Panagrellus redivivus TaxID=6233 RepID=A0A7E4W977_PANRE
MLGLDTFEIYRGNSTKTQHSLYEYEYSLPFEKIQDTLGWTLYFQENWHHSVTISIVYYVLIRAIQKVMQNRQPFQLQTPLFLWNGALAIFSIVGLVRFSEDFLVNLYHNGLTYSLCHSCNPESVAAFWSLAFAISKIVELGDTLFIVLRKKPLIFLHYYHHAAVLVYTVHSGAEHTAPGQAFITMNYLAHSFMYTYYAMAALGKKFPRWVSMFVTTVQTTQMFLGVAVTCYVYYLKQYTKYKCQQSMGNLYLAFTIYITFAILFVRFFIDAYIKKNKLKEAEKAKKQ